MSKARVLVTDGEQRAALAIVRSLGAAGYEVYVCGPRSRSLAGASRFAQRQAAVPDPLRCAAAFTADVRRLVERWGIDVVVPVSEGSLLALLPERDSLHGARIPFASLEAFERLRDKATVLEAARGVGIRIPDQRQVDTVADLDRLEPDALRYPLVVKPTRSVVGTQNDRAKSTVTHVAGPDTLRGVLAGLPADAFPVLLQERIVGPGTGVFLLLWEGEVFAAFAHRRIREKPPAGGVSVYRESIPLDPELLARSHALLRAFEWDGVAMVEYKIDAATGTPFLMEINGRFWGSLQLAVDAGVDFPALLLDLVTGARPEPVTSYRIGVRTRWWWGDVDHLLARIRRSKAALSLPPDAPGRLRAAVDFLAASGPGTRNEVLRLKDPGPAIRETLDWFARR